MSANNGSGSRRLFRVREGRLLAGVASGIAAYFGVDVNLVRLAFGIFTIFYGLGVLIYLTAWVIIPDEGEDGSILESFISRHGPQGPQGPR